MEDNNIYSTIAERLGVPGSKRFIKILEYYFTPEEGQIILQLTQGAANEAKIGGIEISPVPQFSAITAANGNVTLTWLTYPGKNYRLLYKNNLNETNWLILGNDLTASAGALSLTNGIGTNVQRYFKVRQLD